MISFLFSLIAPKKCVSCHNYGTFFCESCKDTVLKQEPYCYICKKPSAFFTLHPNCKENYPLLGSFDKIIVYGHYNGSILKKVIHALKFYKKRELVNDLGSVLGDLFVANESLVCPDDYVFISPPMHFLRQWKRGYNHSFLLSKSIAQRLGVREISFVLQKKTSSKQQSKLHKYERLINVKDSFQVKKKYQNQISDKICIIVDDVVSTGSTLSEIAKILKQAGAKKTIGLVIASD